jgi:hypothetical protein
LIPVRGDLPTLLGRNAIVLSKQARKYARSTGVTSVVLFDGRNMIGLTFAVSNEEAWGWHEVRAPVAYWAVSEEFENESINSPLEIGRTFREALLSTLYSSVMRRLGSITDRSVSPFTSQGSGVVSIH